MCSVSTIITDINFMKTKTFIFLFALFTFVSGLVYAQKTYSQRTYTLFPDGHYERKTCYTDGSCDKLEQGPFHVPKKGDYKHIEEVWRNGAWVQTVVQYY